MFLDIHLYSYKCLLNLGDNKHIRMFKKFLAKGDWRVGLTGQACHAKVHIYPVRSTSRSSFQHFFLSKKHLHFFLYLTYLPNLYAFS